MKNEERELVEQEEEEKKIVAFRSSYRSCRR